ncbi:TKL protein kinase [Fonticula alba]|uniref:TKL protein kinase n=1 Tax=Fonticula alba TaxID=691883 RepID=A0A058Z3P5_FONAL|nr:TKL protein kinase [Fonticula alba]KCV68142.1 TKL protein kinase [Fonticula alba]|eukprot:XP_009497516.1 TKL protein kinase [Fonticula alba]
MAPPRAPHGRRGWPGRQSVLLAALVLLQLLALCQPESGTAAAAAGLRDPAPLYRAPVPLFPGIRSPDDAIGFFGRQDTSGLSYLAVFQADGHVAIHQQAGIQYAINSQARSGAFFSATPTLEMGKAITRPGPYRLVLAASDSGPAFLAFAATWAGLFKDGEWLTFDMTAGPVDVLDYLALAPLQVLVVVRATDSNALYLLQLSVQLMERKLAVPGSVTGPITARISRRPAIQVALQDGVYFFEPGGAGPLQPVGHLPLPGHVSDLAVVKMPNTNYDGLVLVLQQQQQQQQTIHICPEIDLAWNCAGGHQLAPPGGPMADLRLRPPPGGELFAHPPTDWLLVGDAATGAMYRVFLAANEPDPWQAVLLPPGLTAPEALQVMYLAMAGGSAAPQEALTDRQTAYFHYQAFCQGDSTVSCDSPDFWHLASDDGYTCSPGRALSPLNMPASLCGACAAGFFMPSHATGSCSPCSSAMCEVCSLAGDCLVCQAPRLLQMVPASGKDACVVACSPGFVPDAGGTRCVPPAAMAQASPSAPQPLAHAQAPALVVFRSYVHVENGQCRLYAADTPVSQLAGNLLALSGSDSPPEWIRPNPAPPGGVLTTALPCPAAGTLSEAFFAAVELPPALDANGRMVSRVVACQENGSLYVRQMACAAADSSNTLPCTLVESLPSNHHSGFGQCASLRQVSARRVSMLTAAGQLRLLTIDPQTGTSHLQSLAPVSWHPVLLPGMRATQSTDEWLLMHLADSRSVVLQPLDLLLGSDPRTQVARRLLALRAPDPMQPDPRHLEPVLLPGIRPGAPTGELFLSGAQPGPGGLARWVVGHLPFGGLPHGRSADLPLAIHVLGHLDPGSANVLPAFRTFALPVPWSADVPGLLVLLTPELVGVALVHCGRPPGRTCWPQPARFIGLDPPLASLDRVSVGALPLAASPGAAPPGGVLILVPGMQGSQPGPGWTIRLAPVACPPGTYGPECRQCDQACITCLGPGADMCTECRYWLAGQEAHCLDRCDGPVASAPGPGECACQQPCTQCQVAPEGLGYRPVCAMCAPGWALPQPATPSAGGCGQCHASCATCSLPADPLQCAACLPGAFLLEGVCLGACPEGFFPDASATCRACPAGCLHCTLPDSCSTCAPKHFWGGPAVGCARCDASCATCDNASSCGSCMAGLVFLDPQAPSLCGSTCAPGEYVGAGRCAACDVSCALCDQAADRCQVCAAGFRWSGPAPAAGATGTCVPCELGCASCRASGCLVCGAGLVLDPNGQCVADCPAGMFSNGESCQPCDVSCRTCAGDGADQCTGCDAGLELVEAAPGVGTCVSGCLDSEYRAGVDCLPCDGACATCNGPSDKDCWRCAGAVLQGDDCVQACAAGHVAVADRCLACHPSCSECAGVRSTECTGCPGDLYPLPAEQWPSRCAGACPVGYHTSASGCRQCTEHCSSCPHNATTCALCERGWLLAGPACVSSCPAGSLATGGVCTTCHESCGTCYGPEPEHCLTCDGNSPLLVDGRCLATCPAGTFHSGETCLPCSPTCGACSGPGAAECTACPADRVMHGNACLTSCPAGYFAEADRTCRACHGSCLACAGAAADQCTDCPETWLLQQGECVKSCLGAAFACSASRACEACPSRCARCIATAAGASACTPSCQLCEGGFVLSPSTGACAASCPAGEYSTGSGTCAPCGPSCRACFGAAEHCTSCMDPDAWLHAGDGVCLSACPAGGLAAVEFPAAAPPLPGRVCLACPAGCERCAAGPGTPACAFGPDGELVCPEADRCDRCISSHLLSGGSCVASCPGGTFVDRDAPAPACAPCHANCKTCTGPGEEECTSSTSAGRRLALGLGIGLGLLLLLLLLLLVLFLLLRLRRQRGAPTKTDDDEDATVMNTMLELSLPGSILVSIASDFAPLNEEQLGAGTQASVYAARAVGAGISDRLGCPGTVAIKQLKAERMNPTQVTLFQNEVALMWLLRDAPNIVRLYGYSDQPPALVMERFDTDLATLLHSDVPLDQGAILDICQQWASGLEAMHAQGIAHRDLKPGNVFASQRPDGGWRAALGDLGTSRNLNADRSSTLVSQAPELNAMTARYAAPEALAAFHRKRPLDPELLLPGDIYSAAVMLWECLTRTVPWQGRTFEQISSGVLAGVRPPADGLHGPLADLLHMAWDSNGHTRPLAASLRQQVATQVAFLN